MLHGKNYLPTGPKNNKRRRQGQWNSKHAPRGYTSSAPADFLFSPHHVRFSCMKKKKKNKKSPDLKILKSFVSLEEFIWFSLTIHKHQWTIYFPTLHCAQLSSKSNFPFNFGPVEFLISASTFFFDLYPLYLFLSSSWFEFSTSKKEFQQKHLQCRQSSAKEPFSWHSNSLLDVI